MKKIMFNDRYGLTTAVLDGRKTMTRRIIPVDETRGGLVPISFWNGKWRGSHGRPLKSQPYKRGEVLGVAICYQLLLLRMRQFPKISRTFIGAIIKAHDLHPESMDDLEKFAAWNNKMFVKPELMPHRIRITNVRVERIQDISDEDCMREGVRKLESDGCPTMFTFDGWRFKNKVNRCTDSPKEVFEALFKKLSGKKAWDDNPWVFVYEFELVK